jgi:hypothetical protein
VLATLQGREHGHAWCARGSVALSLCTTAQPLPPATIRPNPRHAPRRAALGTALLGKALLELGVLRSGRLFDRRVELAVDVKVILTQPSIFCMENY